MSAESFFLKPLIHRFFKQFIAKEPKRLGDKLVFRQPRALVVLMGVMGFVLIPVLFIDFPERDEAGPTAFIGFIVFIIAIFIITAAYAYYRFEMYDDGRIIYKSMYGQKLDFYFVNIENLKPDDKGGIIIRLDNGRKVRFDRFTTGEPAMYKLLQDKLPEIKLAELKEAYPKKFRHR